MAWRSDASADTGAVCPRRDARTGWCCRGSRRRVAHAWGGAATCAVP
jgi:hypothetical protein